MFVLLLFGFNIVSYGGEYETYEQCKKIGELVVSNENYRWNEFIRKNNPYIEDRVGAIEMYISGGKTLYYKPIKTNYVVSCNKK